MLQNPTTNPSIYTNVWCFPQQFTPKIRSKIPWVNRGHRLQELQGYRPLRLTGAQQRAQRHDADDGKRTGRLVRLVRCSDRTGKRWP